MTKELLWGIFIPFVGTLTGSAFVLFVKADAPKGIFPILNGSAAGVMTAAGVWSLILPGISYAGALGKLSFLPVAIGFFAGILFMLPLEKLAEKTESSLQKGENKNSLSFFAVTLHNFPEGLAVGVALAAAVGLPELMPSAVALSTGIALQNIPEGAIVSLPKVSEGKGKAMMWGGLSGLAEPVAAVAALLLYGAAKAVLPFFMGFAAGAMMFVVMGELADGMKKEGAFTSGIVSFALGFCVMMGMDVAFG